MLRATIFAGAVIGAVVASLPAMAHDGRPHEPQLAGPADHYAFALPEPGSYRLPPVKQAAGGWVLDESGGKHDLADLVRGQVSVLAFIYTQCADVCPIATARLLELHDLAARDPGIASRLRLISMSFNPEYDTPAVMREHAELWRGPAGGVPEWLFLTAPDAQGLAPILTAYDQTFGRKPDPDDPSGALNHILRVFLIDDEGTVRNIYSLDFLDPRLVLNDTRTLLMGRANSTPRARPSDAQSNAGAHAQPPRLAHRRTPRQGK